MMNSKMMKNKTETALHGKRSILEVLAKDHDDLRKLIDVMKSGSHDYSRKKEAYAEFSELLKSHAKSEEKAVYEMALEFKDIKMDTFEAYEEHEVAAALMKKIDKTKNKDQWMGRVKVLAEAVEHHIIEEENTYLKDVKKKLKGHQELDMVGDFMKRRERSKHQPSDAHNGIMKEM